MLKKFLNKQNNINKINNHQSNKLNYLYKIKLQIYKKLLIKINKINK